MSVKSMTNVMISIRARLVELYISSPIEMTPGVCACVRACVSVCACVCVRVYVSVCVVACFHIILRHTVCLTKSMYGMM